MSEAFKESTVVTIAHRTNTIINSDLVIILDQGTVLEQGDPNSLPHNKDHTLQVFYKNCKKQNFDQCLVTI